ncbi:hypothetical protein ACN28S_26790 [Cystobacter fuscus]
MMLFYSVFVAPLTVENRTGQPLLITPVGTVHGRGHKAPLPTVMFARLAIPSPRAGPFPIVPMTPLVVARKSDPPGPLPK